MLFRSTHPDEPLGSSCVLYAVHTPPVTRPTSPQHTQTIQLARLVFFLLSTQPSFTLPLHTPLVTCFTSQHTKTSQEARLVFFLLSTQRRRSPYLSTQPSSLALPRNFNPIRVNSYFSTLHLTLLLFLTDCAQVPQCRCSYCTALILDSNLRGLHLACHS